MAKKLKDLYDKRKGKYAKPTESEHFLLELNKTLQQKERRIYDDQAIKHPFIFVFGLPRSGTTLITQLIAHAFDLGYINNFVARFWLAPLHGIKLFRSIYGDYKHTDFKSDFARTSDISDIHEFGYFWRHWLKKESFEGVTRAGEIESSIDWQGLYQVLANIQNVFDRPMVFKNIFGSYHLKKMKDVLKRVIYVYIERDQLDAALSILNARKKYYGDPNTWWSYMPVEYDQIKDLDYRRQIAGQVYYLKRFYDNEIERNRLDNVVRISYEQMAKQPRSVLEAIAGKSVQLYGSNLNIVTKPPERFPFRTYEDHEEERQIFKQLIAEFANEDMKGS